MFLFQEMSVALKQNFSFTLSNFLLTQRCQISDVVNDDDYDDDNVDVDVDGDIDDFVDIDVTSRRFFTQSLFVALTFTHFFSFFNLILVIHDKNVFSEFG